MMIYARSTHNNNATLDSPGGRLFGAAIWLDNYG